MDGGSLDDGCGGGEGLLRTLGIGGPPPPPAWKFLARSLILLDLGAGRGGALLVGEFAPPGAGLEPPPGGRGLGGRPGPGADI